MHLPSVSVAPTSEIFMTVHNDDVANTVEPDFESRVSEKSSS